MIYSLILSLRHLFYDKGWKKSTGTDVPSICVGNIAAGGTGKTPMTELIIRTLQEDEPEAEQVIKKEDLEYDGLFAGVGLYDGHGFGGGTVQEKNASGTRRQIAVLSRGYKRKTRGFQQVTADGTVERYGDEPLQIKRKFPSVTVAVDANRRRGADLLAHPEKIASLREKERRLILNPSFPPSDIIILDDAFQHRKIKADKNIVLTTFSKPYTKDHLLPFGGLRDLKSRARKADVIIVTKCPTILDEWEKTQMAAKLGLSQYDPHTCTALNRDGKKQIILFSTVLYDAMQAVFPEGNPRYVHSKSAILFSGIANDIHLQQHLCENYKLVDHFQFQDHHYFSKKDVMAINTRAISSPVSVVITTEKDAQRLRTFPRVPQDLRLRTFYCPIRTMMLTANEQKVFKNFLTS